MKKFKFLLFFILIFNLAVFSDLYSKKSEKLLKIGAVDLKKVFDKSPGKKMVEEKLDKMKKDFEGEKIKREAEIKKMQEEYDGKKISLSGSDKEQKELDIKKKTLELKEYIQASNQKLDEEENKLLTPLVDELKDVIKAVSITGGYDIILDKSTYILYVEKDLDITEEVLKALSEKYK